MTESEWLASSDPPAMLELVGKMKPDPRKLRLFACACCRTVWNETWPQRSRDVILAAEQFADGRITEKELNNSRSLACQIAQNAIVRNMRRRVEHSDWVLGGRLTFAADAALPNHHIAYQMTVTCLTSVFREDQNLRLVIPAVLRDIFGNVFHPVALEQTWLTSDVLLLATGIDEERAFDRLPILADALQDAGCDNEDLLNHLRSDGPHVLGCWAIDLVLGKS